MEKKPILTRDSKIVEVCSQIMTKPNEVDNQDYQLAVETIKELASNPNPNNLYELGQLVGFLVDDRLTQDLSSYINIIADTQTVSDGDKLLFKTQMNNAFALWQAKGSTAQRYEAGTKYVTIESNEVSASPSIQLEQLSNGQINFSTVVEDASNVMEQKIVKQIETVIKEYWDDLGSPWYASGSGITSSIDDLIVAIGRLGKPIVLGDIGSLQGFTALSAFNSNVADPIAVEFHKNGVIGSYKGATLVQLMNSFTNDTSIATTALLLDPGYVYILPAGASKESRPLKVGFEGPVQTFETKYAQSRILEIAMYKKVGIGLASSRYGMALYNNTSL